MGVGNKDDGTKNSIPTVVQLQCAAGPVLKSVDDHFITMMRNLGERSNKDWYSKQKISKALHSQVRWSENSGVTPATSGSFSTIGTNNGYKLGISGAAVAPSCPAVQASTTAPDVRASNMLSNGTNLLPCTI